MILELMAMQPPSSALYKIQQAEVATACMASTNVLETEDTGTSTMLESSCTCVYRMQDPCLQCSSCMWQDYSYEHRCEYNSIVDSSANARLQTELVASAKKVEV